MCVSEDRFFILLFFLFLFFGWCGGRGGRGVSKYMIYIHVIYFINILGTLLYSVLLWSQTSHKWIEGARFYFCIYVGEHIVGYNYFGTCIGLAIVNHISLSEWFNYYLGKIVVNYVSILTNHINSSNTNKRMSVCSRLW